MSDGVLIAIITAVPATLTAVLSLGTTINRRTRAKLQRLARSLDEAQTYITESRRQRHMHNDQFHQHDGHAIDVPALPSFFTSKEDE